MMPDFESVPLSASEHLKYQAIVDHLTHPEIRQQLSEAMRKVSRPQGYFVAEAWQRAARKMWRTAPPA